MKAEIIIVALLTILIGCVSSEFNPNEWKKGDSFDDYGERLEKYDITTLYAHATPSI